MMKKHFNEAKIELIVLAASDVIATSGNDGPFAGNDDIIEYE